MSGRLSWNCSIGEDVNFIPYSAREAEKEGFLINKGWAHLISYLLESCSVEIESDSNILINEDIEWHSNTTLNIKTKKNIILKATTKVINKVGGTLCLRTGIGSNDDKGKVVFEGGKQVDIADGNVYVYYNSEIGHAKHKYHNPRNYLKHIESKEFISYMLINNVNDLQDVELFLHGDYALSQNIDASSTRYWNGGKGFHSLKHEGYQQPSPFSGNFDGNGFSVSHLYINRPEEKFTGLFGIIVGSEGYNAAVKNLVLKDAYVVGGVYAGLVAGMSEFVDLSNITLIDNELHAEEMVGGVVGTAQRTNFDQILLYNNAIQAGECNGMIAGAIQNSVVTSYAIDYSEEECFGCIDQDEDGVQIFLHQSPELLGI